MILKKQVPTPFLPEAILAQDENIKGERKKRTNSYWLRLLTSLSERDEIKRKSLVYGRWDRVHYPAFHQSQFYYVGWQYLSCDLSMAPYSEAKRLKVISVTIGTLSATAVKQLQTLPFLLCSGESSLKFLGQRLQSPDDIKAQTLIWRIWIRDATGFPASRPFRGTWNIVTGFFF